MLTEKERIARLVSEERRILTSSLHTAPDIQKLFQRYRCEWMARSLGCFSEEIVRELYVSYAASLRGSIDKRAKPVA